MRDTYTIEICAGSLTDALTANKYPIDRIELNSALELGGLTPSLSTFLEVKKHVDKKIICMVRPRTAGFSYNTFEKETMFLDAKVFLDNKADGIVFGFLDPDNTIDIENTTKMVDLIHSYHKEAVFHKAFDEVSDPYTSIQDLIQCHVDRVLTSGGQANVIEGIEVIKKLEEEYGDQIEILPGGGILPSNIVSFLEESNVKQFHMTAKSTFHDNGEYVAVNATNIQAVLDKIHLSKKEIHTSILTREDEEMFKNDPYEESKG